jgi:hypothetical protein
MADSQEFIDFGLDALARDTAEIGMHLHAWDSPPIVPLTDNDHARQPYLIEYPDDVIRQKVRAMTGKLEDTFGVKMTSHRAGRWAVNETYMRALSDCGYLADCSVTPYVRWESESGVAGLHCQVDYTQFPDRAYFIDPVCIAHEGESTLLEVPTTPVKRPLVRRLVRRLRRRKGNWRDSHDDYIWLRPQPGNLPLLLALLRTSLAQSRDYVQFMLHSSELMPHGSPSFPDARSIERLYDDLESLFSAAAGSFIGRTLTEHHAQFTARQQQPVSTA